MKLRKNKGGFTLVELLLVMAIIGILAAIIFISIGSARKRARITTFKESMKNLAVAATQCTDNGGSINDATADGGTDLCSTGGIGKIPNIRQCNGTNGFVEVTANPNVGDDFEITSTCTVADTVDCVATCTANGCEFDDPGNPGNNDGCPRTK